MAKRGSASGVKGKSKRKSPLRERRSDAPAPDAEPRFAYIVGQHRSLALANNHLRRLEKKFPNRIWIILFRRNAQGEDSARGHFFTFRGEQALEAPEPEGVEEYQINVKYTRKGESKLEVQISATGPAGSSREDILEAIEETRHARGTPPPGWKVRIKVWERAGNPVTKGKTANDEHSWSSFNFFYDESEVFIGGRRTVGNGRKDKRKK